MKTKFIEKWAESIREKEISRVETSPRVHYSTDSIQSVQIYAHRAHTALYSLNFVQFFPTFFFSVLVICLLAIHCTEFRQVLGASVRNLNLKIVEMKNFCDSFALNSLSVYRWRCASRVVAGQNSTCSPFCVYCFGILLGIHWAEKAIVAVEFETVPGVCSCKRSLK